MVRSGWREPIWQSCYSANSGFWSHNSGMAISRVVVMLQSWLSLQCVTHTMRIAMMYYNGCKYVWLVRTNRVYVELWKSGVFVSQHSIIHCERCTHSIELIIFAFITTVYAVDNDIPQWTSRYWVGEYDSVKVGQWFWSDFESCESNIHCVRSVCHQILIDIGLPTWMHAAYNDTMCNVWTCVVVEIHNLKDHPMDLLTIVLVEWIGQCGLCIWRIWVICFCVCLYRAPWEVIRLEDRFKDSLVRLIW